jgi:ribosomal protein S18 acetylase RimI-like enzyme
VSSPSLALQEAMRAALLAHAPLRLLLGGAHVHEELPRGARPPFVLFETIETRDWSVADQKAHEHFVALSVKTNSRSRRLAQQVLDEIETVLDGAGLSLAGHRLVNLRLTFWSVTRQGETYGANLRFRAATEPV